MIQDLRFSLRHLKRHAAATAATVLTLALGIGACTTIFSVVNAVLLRPLPYPDPERLVTLWETHPEQAPDSRVASFSAAAVWGEELDELAELALSRPWRPILSRGAELVGLKGAKVSAGFFPLLGIEPILGRPFSPQDDLPGADPVVLLSHGFWQRRFGGDPELVGTPIALEGSGPRLDATVIGILPPDLGIAEPIVFEPAEIWAPLALDPARAHFGQRYLRVIGRLAATADAERARAHLRAVSGSLAERYPDTNGGWVASMESLSEQLKAPVRPALLSLLAGVGFVFLVACCNVGILLLSQATTRRREIAVRLAMGAGPLRVGRLILSECLLMAVASGLLGLLVARQGLAVVVAHAFDTMPRYQEISVDHRVLLFTLALSLATVALFGLLPAVRAARADAHPALRETGRAGRAGGRRGERLRRSLVLAEIALSLVLLIAATLMLRSFERLAATDPGFVTQGVTTLRLQLPRSLYPETARVDALYQSLLQEIRDLPRVEDAALVNHLPMQGASMSTRAAARSAPEETIQVEFRGASSRYFRTLGIPLLAGRDLAPHGGDGSERPVVLLSESAAARLWPGEESVGKRLILGWGTREAREVVGVVGDVRHHGVRTGIQPTVYLPYHQAPHRSMALVVRTDTPQTLIAGIRARARDLDRAFVIQEIQPLSQVVRATISEPRSRALLIAAFASMALLLAAGGTYGMVAYSVSQRRYDFSVRQALGARPRQLVRRTVVEGLRQALLGVGIGLAGSLVLARGFSGLLYGVSSHDPWTLIGATALMTAVVLLASYIPARRVMKLSPATALRDA